MMKIAFIVPDNRDEFRRWDDPEPVFGPAPTALLEGFAMLPDVEVHVIAAVHRPMRGTGRIYPNVSYSQVVVGGGGWKALYAGCIWGIRKELTRIGPDIVHGQGTERYCALAAAFSGLPNLLSIHGNMREVVKHMRGKALFYGRIAAFLEVFALRHSRHVLCISSYTQRLVASIAKHTWVVPNAVSSSWFEVFGLPIEARTRRVLVIANICDHKNQNSVLRLWENALPPDFECVFCGGGVEGSPYFEEFRSLVAARPWATYAGFLEGSTLREAVAGASAVLLPSMEDNCPMVLLEAMACGTPVVASAVGGIPDIVNDGITGRLFDPHDTEGMKRQIEAVFIESHRTKEMAEEARKIARERFSPEAVARRHVEVYREIVSDCSTFIANACPTGVAR